MTRLTTVHITTQDDIVEWRNKFLALLSQLKFSDTKSVAIATNISDVMHHLYNNDLHAFNVDINVDHDFEGDQLIIDIQTHNVNKDKLIDYVGNLSCDIIQQNELTILRFSLPITSKAIHLDADFLQTLRENIVIQSKTELMRQIKNKNEELKKILEDLKKSTALVQSEKMRALGVLTAGVAHELNNPMMGILNFIQYCLKKTDSNDKRYEALKDAETETKRCIDIVTNLLTFSHLDQEKNIELKPVNMDVLIKRVIKILAYRLRNENVTVNENIQPNLPLIMGHENRLQQVLLNIIANALDAMKDSVKKNLSLSLHSSSDSLKIEIEDTGEGMDETTRDKIFEPFFTTKQTGSGTGLGLSVCESIIKEHAGHIHCYSEKNKGTQFLITLPIATGD